MIRILENIRIVDLTTVVLGPYATQMLSDLGAEVIKVESPGGDIFRYVGPYRHRGMGAGFLNINKNKQSLCLDLKNSEDWQHLQTLTADADVFVHNMRPTAARRLHIDYDSVRKTNPEIIYCAAMGFGQTGDYANRPAYDDIIQAESGIAWLAGAIHDAPQYVPTVMADKIAALFTVQSILAAIVHKQRTGQGTHIEVPMFECLASFLLAEHIAEKTFSYDQGEAGYTRMMSKNRRPFKTQDAYITVMPYSKKHWLATLDLLNIGDDSLRHLIEDDTTRSENIDFLYGYISDKFSGSTTDEWLARLEANDIPCGRVNSLNDLFRNPHLLSVDFFNSYDHPTEGRVNTTRHPVSFINVAHAPDSPPPNLGEYRGWSNDRGKKTE